MDRSRRGAGEDNDLNIAYEEGRKPMAAKTVEEGTIYRATVLSQEEEKREPNLRPRKAELNNAIIIFSLRELIGPT